MFHMLVMNTRLKEHEEIIFEGTVSSVLLPGVEGEFEVLDFHKPIISRLKKGIIYVDNQKEIPIQDGVVKMSDQKLVAMVNLR